MGMFDEIKCEYPLPDKEAQSMTFQTKDLECLMDEYTITKEGRLVLHAWSWEETPEAEKPYPNAEPGSWQSLYGIFRKAKDSERLEDQDYHGDLYMYCGDYEYTVRFTEGVVSSIKRWQPVASVTEEAD